MLKKIFNSLVPKASRNGKAPKDTPFACQTSPTPTHAAKDENAHFMGEHFEGLGSAWNALCGAEVFVNQLADLFSKAVLDPNCQIQGDDATATLLQYPSEDADIRAAMLVATPNTAERGKLISSYPVLKGLPNRLLITNRHSWDNGMEGVVAACQEDSGAPVTFFAPFYFRDQSLFRPDSHLTISLAALALRLERAEQQEITVSKGPFYQDRLTEFLEENPDKTEADFPHPVISMRGLRALLPSHYVCEWEYRCPVLDVAQTTFLDVTLYRMTVIFVGTDGEELKGYLYASESVLNGYVPQVGDDILGILWMTGIVA